MIVEKYMYKESVRDRTVRKNSFCRILCYKILVLSTFVLEHKTTRTWL